MMSERSEELPVETKGQRLPRPARVTEQSWPVGTVPVVSICCITYNHAPYIRECLEGFLMQKTTFPVEILIHDDASTDGTADIIREYEEKHPGLIRAIYQTENQYSKGIKPIRFFALPRASSAYVALCEGDDYWVDPLKLQKQIDLLDRHPQYVLCWTRFEKLEQKSGDRVIDGNGRYFSGNGGTEFDFARFCESWDIGMQTLVFRRQALSTKNFDDPQYKDIFMISDLLTAGPGYCLQDVTAVYRLHEGGVYSSRTKLEKVAFGARTYKAILQAHPKNEFLRRKCERYWTLYVDKLFKRGAYKEALAAAIDYLTPTTNGVVADPDQRLLAHLEKKLRESDDLLVRREKELLALRGGWSYRLGRALTLPARAARDLAASFGAASSRWLVSRSARNKEKFKERGIEYIDTRQVMRESRRLKPLPLPRPPRTPRLIVSLTSYPARMNEVFFALVSLLQQTTPPDAITLWLGEDKFPRKEADLPGRVAALRQYGVTVKWCKDLRAYTKLVPALRAYPDDIIVTADDDIYYPSDWLGKLYVSYLADRNVIHAHRAHRIRIGANGDLDPYRRWAWCASAGPPSFSNFLTGVGGVLYPPGCLHKEVTDEALFMRLSPSNDDIWFWAMAVLNGTKIRVVDGSDATLKCVNPELEAGLSKGATLSQVNRKANDRQLRDVIAYLRDSRGVDLVDKLNRELTVGQAPTPAPVSA